MTNTLSQLGNPRLNPSGAIFYNVGIFVISLPIFLIAVLLMTNLGKQLMASRGGNTKVLFYLILSFMLLFASFNMLTAFVPAGVNDAINSLYTLAFFVSFELFVTLSSVGIGKLKNHVSWVPKLGFTVAIINLLLVIASVITQLPIVSWMIAIASWFYMTASVYEFS